MAGAIHAAGKQVQPMIRMLIRLYRRTYLNHYLKLIHNTENELHRWAPVIAAGRLNENIAPEREALIEIVKGGYKND